MSMISELKNIARFVLRDLKTSVLFLLDRDISTPLSQRWVLLRYIYKINNNVESPHTQEEMLGFIKAILLIRPENNGVVVEAGCFKGSSTAKFSMACAIAGRELVVFDSFQGIPDNNENHTVNIFGGSAGFSKGDYCGSLAEVKSNVETWGVIDVCTFVPGWLEDTLPRFNKEVAIAYIDVDLVSSTKTCIKYLWPLLKTGGLLYSQDGHLPLVIEAINDDGFWENEIGCPKPEIIGLGTSKLIKIVKT